MTQLTHQPMTDTELKLDQRKFISRGGKKKGMLNNKAMSLKVVISEPDVGIGDFSGRLRDKKGCSLEFL